jgi:hypothetical protein
LVFTSATRELAAGKKQNMRETMTHFTRRQAFTVAAGAAAAVTMPLGHEGRAAVPPSASK